MIVKSTTSATVWKIYLDSFKRGCLWVHERERTDDFRIDASNKEYHAWMMTLLKRAHNKRNANRYASFFVSRDELNRIMEHE